MRFNHSPLTISYLRYLATGALLAPPDFGTHKGKEAKAYPQHKNTRSGPRSARDRYRLWRLFSKGGSYGVVGHYVSEGVACNTSHAYPIHQHICYLVAGIRGDGEG